MIVFDTEYKDFFNVNEKEDMRVTMYLVTKEEERQIRETIEGGGEFWIENGEVKVSGPKMVEYMKFNLDTKLWTEDPDLKAKYLERIREEVWEKIKQKRSESIETGVYHARLQKWFHTDSEAQRNYALIGHAISSTLYQPKRWKTMDGTFIEMTREVFQDVLALALKKADDDYRNAEIHKAKVMASTDPLAYDYSTGWSAGYTKGAINEEV